MDLYDNPWIFQGKPFTEDQIGKSEGFVYALHDTVNNKWYVGRKYFWFIRKQRGKTRRVRKPSDWKKYYGSSAAIHEIIEEHGTDVIKRYIVSIHQTKGDVNKGEESLLWRCNVLENNLFYNESIGNHKDTSQAIKEDRRIDQTMLTTVMDIGNE